MSETELTATLDRFEELEDGEEMAVLLIESDGEVVDEEVVPSSRLPKEGRQQDAVFTVTVVDGDPEEFTYEPDATAERAASASNRFDRLSTRLSDGDDADEDTT
ncbi:DUF3006 domain-containing protein [Halorarum salinum]|uniref:DUF3006 domain-containing protein n=1 Tax=Halorarum salinum TaxID=2743089 RepID=A0A7D5L9V3_9EURY|nr:DUF3006 domain-containing protein [Halobaculum salinum]QLG61075.1 DUF3006 domain-containing protein [Halobaculum salinum]